MAANNEEDIQQLQLMEQNMQHLLQQKQQFQAQLAEVESASNELVNAKKAYKIIGNLMVEGDSSSLNSDLSQKKEILAVRIKNIEKREEQLKEKVKSLQQKVLKSLETKK